jgi:hypothetical protein
MHVMLLNPNFSFNFVLLLAIIKGMDFLLMRQNSYSRISYRLKNINKYVLLFVEDNHHLYLLINLLYDL